MSEHTYEARLRKYAEAIKTLAASSDLADQRKAVQLSQILQDMRERHTAEAVKSGDIPTTPPTMQERIAASEETPIEQSVRETGNVLGPTYADRSFWQKAGDFGKQVTSPESTELLASLAATPLSIAAYTIPAIPALNRLGTVGRAIGSLGPWGRAGLSIAAPVLTGAAAREAALELPWNTDTPHEWGKLSGSLLPWNRGTGTFGSLESLAKWEGLGQQIGPIIKGTTDVARWGIMGPGKDLFGRSVRGRAEDVLARYDALGMRDVAPSYAASKLGLIQALGPGLLKWPGVRGGVLKQYQEAMAQTKGFLLNKIERMNPATFGRTTDEVSASMYKGAMEYGIKTIKAIDRLYGDAYAAAKGLYGDAAVIDLRPFLDLVDEIRGGGLSTMVREADGTRRALRSPPPEGITKWIKEELSLLESRTSIEGLKDLQSAVRRQLESYSPGDLGYRELSRLDGALTGSMRKFFKGGGIISKEGVMVGVSPEASAKVFALFQKADSTNRRFWLSTKTPAGRALTAIEGSFWERRFLTPKSGQRFMSLGTREMDEFYEIAFRNKSPRYLKHLEDIIGPKAYRMASQRWLNDVYDRALTIDKYLDVDSFLRETRINTQPQLAAAALKGSGVDASQLKALGEILQDFPIDPKLQQMLVRRIGLAGGTSALKIGAMGSLLGAGGAAGGILGASFMLVILALGATRRLGTVLSRPKLLEALVEYGKADTKTLKTQALRRTKINSALKLARLLNAQFPDDQIDIERIRMSTRDVTVPAERWVSPVDVRGGPKWTGWTGAGATFEDVLY